jgi:4-amino-4-deoxy-L-arabinose transferase-like glycosyltransferase
VSTTTAPVPAPKSEPAINNYLYLARDLLLLVGLCAVLYGFQIGFAPLANPDEGRYAEIPREMLATNDWVTPRLDGVNYFEKPPLVYWVTAGSLKVFGQTEWPVRLVPALFALAGVLLTYATGRKLYGRAAGLGAGLVLATAGLYVGLARFVMLDMAMSVLMSASLFCFILAVREPPGARRRLLFYGLYASMALAVLTKGLMGFLVTGAIMFLWLLVFNQWRRLLPFYLPTGALLFLGIALPWHILAAQRNPTWVGRYLIYEHLLRYLTPAASRTAPWWYFIPVVLVGLFPWTGFLWPSLSESLRGGWAARKRNVDAWFFVLWAVFIFGFFSASQSKLPPYVLPLFPPLAILVGIRLAVAWRGGRGRVEAGIVLFTITCVLMATTMLALVFRPTLVHNFSEDQALLLRPYVIAMAAILLAGAAMTPHFAQIRGPRAALCSLVTTMVLFFGTLSFAVPYITSGSTKPLAAIFNAQARPGDRIVHYHEFFHDFTFYAARVVDVAGEHGELELKEDAAARASDRFFDEAEFRRRWEGTTRLWVVAKKREVKKLFADPTFHYHLMGESSNHLLFSNQP